MLIEQAEALGETPEDPLMWHSVLYGFAAVNVVAFNGDVLRELAEQLNTRAEKQGATAPMMVAHRKMGHALLLTGEIAAAQAHYSQGLALYDPWNTVRLRPVLVKTSASRTWAFGRSLFGCLAIPRRHLRTLIAP